MAVFITITNVTWHWSQMINISTKFC